MAITKFLSVFSGLLFIVIVPEAHADQILTLNVGNTAINACCGAGPFGTVDFSQTNSSTVDVTVTLNNPYLFVDTGGAGAFAFNLVNILFSNLTFAVSPASVAAGFSSTVVGDGTASGHMDGFGFFDYAIQGDANHTQGGSSPIGSVLSFTISTNDGSDLPFSDFDVSSVGGNPSYVAADIYQPVDPNITTGFVGTNVGNDPVPEPGTTALMGAGLLAIGLLVRKRVPHP